MGTGRLIHATDLPISPAALTVDTVPAAGTSADPQKAGALSCWPCKALCHSTLQSQGHPAWQCLCGCIIHTLCHRIMLETAGLDWKLWGALLSWNLPTQPPALDTAGSRRENATKHASRDEPSQKFSAPQDGIQEHKCVWLHCQVLSRVVWKWVFCFQFYLVKDVPAKLISCCSVLSE